MRKIVEKYMWHFFNSAVGTIPIVTDKKDVVEAVVMYKALGYKHTDRVEFVGKVYVKEELGGGRK